MCSYSRLQLISGSHRVRYASYKANDIYRGPVDCMGIAPSTFPNEGVRQEFSSVGSRFFKNMRTDVGWENFKYKWIGAQSQRHGLDEHA